jgi:hypothetical protein
MHRTRVGHHTEYRSQEILQRVAGLAHARRGDVR